MRHTSNWSTVCTNTSTALASTYTDRPPKAILRRPLMSDSEPPINCPAATPNIKLLRLFSTWWMSAFRPVAISSNAGR